MFANTVYLAGLGIVMYCERVNSAVNDNFSSSLTENKCLSSNETKQSKFGQDWLDKTYHWSQCLVSSALPCGSLLAPGLSAD